MRVGRGSVYKRPDSNVWWIRWYRAGRCFRESSNSTKKTTAQGLLAKRLGAVARGELVSIEGERLTFEEAFADMLNDYKINGRKSLDGVERRGRLHLAPFFGGCRMIQITTADIRRFIAKRQEDRIVVRAARRERRPDGTWADVEAVTKPVSAAEINRELAILKRMFALAVKDRGLPHRPYVPMLRESNARQGFFERDQLDAVLRHLPAEVQPVVRFCYLTGWRVNSEVLPLQWKQVDFAAGEVRLNPGETKNREGRIFPFTHELRTLLEAQRASLPKDRICPSVFHRDGQPIKTIRKAWTTARRKAGLPGKLLHDFRRTAARNFERADVPRTAAMAMIGHKTEAMYRRYAVQDAATLREAAERLNRANQHVSGTLGTGTHGDA